PLPVRSHPAGARGCGRRGPVPGRLVLPVLGGRGAVGGSSPGDGAVPAGHSPGPPAAEPVGLHGVAGPAVGGALVYRLRPRGVNQRGRGRRGPMAASSGSRVVVGLACLTATVVLAAAAWFLLRDRHAEPSAGPEAPPLDPEEIRAHSRGRR